MATLLEMLQGFQPNQQISPVPIPGQGSISGANQPGAYDSLAQYMSPQGAVPSPVTAEGLEGLTAPIGGDGLGISGQTPGTGLEQVGLDLTNPAGGGSDLFKSLSGFGDLAQGAASLFGAYNAFQSLKQAKEQFGFQKDVTNRNLANQATITNDALRARQGARSAFGGVQRAPAQVSGAPI